MYFNFSSPFKRIEMFIETIFEIKLQIAFNYMLRGRFLQIVHLYIRFTVRMSFYFVNIIYCAEIAVFIVKVSYFTVKTLLLLTARASLLAYLHDEIVLFNGEMFAFILMITMRLRRFQSESH